MSIIQKYKKLKEKLQFLVFLLEDVFVSGLMLVLLGGAIRHFYQMEFTSFTIIYVIAFFVSLYYIILDIKDDSLKRKINLLRIKQISGINNEKNNNQHSLPDDIQ